MINSSKQSSYPFTWQTMLWRLLLTLLLLLILAISSLTIFRNATTQPGAQVLPPLSYEIDRR